MLPLPREPEAAPPLADACTSDVAGDERRAALLRTLRHAAALALQAVVLLALLSLFFVRAPQVDGHSMAPQIDAGDHVLLDTLAYAARIERPGGGPPLADLQLHPIARGDVVAFAHGAGDDARIYLKRVIGLPGDNVALERGTVFVDGRVLEEPYAPQHDLSDVPPQTVPADSLYVLGDNRGDSDDSRFWGPVPATWIIGQVFATYWPPDRIGFF